jgi:O-antigen/teichoic acid export membrane protein
MLLNLASVPIVVQATSSEAYGILLLANSVMGYFDLMKSGFPAGMVKYVSEYESKDEPGKVAEIINTALVFYLGVGLLTLVVVWGFVEVGGISLFNVSESNRDTATNVLLIAGGLAIIKWPTTGLGQALNGLQRYAENNLYKGIGSLLSAAMVIAAAWLGFSLEMIFLFQSGAFFVSAVFQHRLLRVLQPQWHLRLRGFDWETFRMIFGYSAWMLLNQISMILIYQTDRIILGMFLPVSSLTVYHVVTTPFRAIKQTSSLFNSALLPVVSSEAADAGREGLDRFIYTASRYSNAFVAPLAVIGFFLAEPFIRVWMGGEFVQYAWIAQVACLCQLLWQSNATLGQVYYGTGKVERLTSIAVAVAIINVPLGIWWVQSFGVAGVVFSTVAASMLAVPLQYLLVFPELEVSRGRYAFNSVARGQWVAWVGGLLLVPAKAYLAALSSWGGFILAGGILTLLFYGAIWFAAVKRRHRNQAQAFIRRDLLAPLIGS